MRMQDFSTVEMMLLFMLASAKIEVRLFVFVTATTREPKPVTKPISHCQPTIKTQGVALMTQLVLYVQVTLAAWVPRPG